MKICKVITSEITPELLAELFTKMDCNEQARFFNHVDVVAHTFESSWTLHLQKIHNSNELTYAGRRVMRELGDC